MSLPFFGGELRWVPTRDPAGWRDGGWVLLWIGAPPITERKVPVMTMTSKPIPQDGAGQRKDQDKNTTPENPASKGKTGGKADQGANTAGPADVAVQSDRDREKHLDGSTDEGASEIPSDKDRGRGVSVNEAR
jgi:hypothetical protein